ncbi:hypothetical protein M885DRAFT_571485 [Pelagophyceae sp. CCMP2097]|nr:hypothetical protein M885DRAFT_571485 [Pelagophyceae sp. CCMP2097]
MGHLRLDAPQQKVWFVLAAQEAVADAHGALTSGVIDTEGEQAERHVFLLSIVQRRWRHTAAATATAATAAATAAITTKTCSEGDFGGFRIHERDTSALAAGSKTSDDTRTFPQSTATGSSCKEYILDDYAKQGASRLLWQQLNQKTIRAECYGSLADAVQARDVANVS